MRPKLSIAYLTKNGDDFLSESIQGVLDQEVDFDYEIIAVDSGSTDSTMKILTSFPIKIMSIDPAEFNFGSTRDLSFSLCSGDILVPISQDVIPADRDWLRNLIEPMRDSAVAAVQGSIIQPINRQSFYWEKAGLFYFTRECRKWISRHEGIGLSFTACAIRRSIWEANKIGPIEMSEDKVFQQKIAEAGYKIVFENKARVVHGHEYNNLSDLAKRCANEGLGWRGAGQEYSFTDMAIDLLSPMMLKEWTKGLILGGIRSWPELFFPFIRPVYVYKGNHFIHKYLT